MDKAKCGPPLTLRSVDGSWARRKGAFAHPAVLASTLSVMAGLVPAIQVFLFHRAQRRGCPGTSSAKTRFALLPGHDDVGRARLFRQDYAARTLTKNSSTALRNMPDWVSSSRALASTSDAALPVAAAAVVTPPMWLEISFDPAATD